MTGWASLAKDQSSHAITYSNGVMTDLGTLGGVESNAFAINDSGQVAGFSYLASGNYHAFLTSGTAMLDLGTLGGANSFGDAMNSKGDVTGWAQTADGVQHAFLYSGGTMTDLNSLLANSNLGLYVTLTESYGINDNGWIIANGVDSRTGQQTAYLLSTTPVPLPSSAVMLAGALLALGAFTGRRATLRLT
jgi:probable HAF family extracellular repeat protein